LQVVLRVPIRVVDDHDVGRSQRDANPAGTRAQQHGEEATFGVLEPVNRALAFLPRHGAVDTFVSVATEVQVVLEDVEHDAELAEDQHAVAVGLQFGQQFVQERELAARLDHLLQGRVPHKMLADDGLGPFDQVRVVAALDEDDGGGESADNDYHQNRRGKGHQSHNAPSAAPWPSWTGAGRPWPRP